MKDYTRSDIIFAINEYIVGRNAERDRKVMYRRLVDGICYEPLAEEFDMSVSQIKRIIYKCQDKIFKHL